MDPKAQRILISGIMIISIIITVKVAFPNTETLEFEAPDKFKLTTRNVESIGNQSSIENQLNFIVDYLQNLNEIINQQEENSTNIEEISQLKMRASIVEELLEAIESKKFGAAYDYSNDLINLNSTDWPAYLIRGITLNELGNPSDAIDDFNEIIDNGYSNEIVYSSRARSHMDLGEYNFALSNYTKSLSLKDDPIVRFNQGNSYLDLEMYDEAISTYEIVLEQDPSDSALINQGVAYRSIGEIDKALVNFELTLMIFPAHEVAVGQIVATYHDLGRDEESLPILEKAIMDNPESVGLWFMKSLVLETLYEKGKNMTNTDTSLD